QGPSLQSRNPADGSVVFDARSADAAQVSLAVTAACTARSPWAQTPLEDRAKVLRRFAQVVTDRREQLAELTVRETGKMPADAAGEVNAVIAKVEITLDAHRQRRAVVDQQSPQGTAQIRYRPLGPVV